MRIHFTGEVSAYANAIRPEEELSVLGNNKILYSPPYNLDYPSFFEEEKGIFIMICGHACEVAGRNFRSAKCCACENTDVFVCKICRKRKEVATQ